MILPSPLCTFEQQSSKEYHRSRITSVNLLLNENKALASLTLAIQTNRLLINGASMGDPSNYNIVKYIQLTAFALFIINLPMKCHYDVIKMVQTIKGK